MIKDSLKLSRELVDFINESPTMYNAVDESEKLLISEGFRKLDPKEKWDIKEGGKYFVSYGNASLFAFVVNSSEIEKYGFRIIGSHCDSPGFRIKNNPEIKANNQIKLNVEPYGGMIISTWLDRPLGIAGKVVLGNPENPMKPKEIIIDMKKPVCIIPNLAIHMNRTVNDGYKFNKQEDVMPLMLDAIKEEPEDNKKTLENLIRKSMDREYEDYDIMDYDLFLYEYEKGSIVGSEDSFISCGRLDNLASVHSSIKALIDSSDDEGGKYRGIAMAAAFNNEEVGSLTKEGADSNIFLNTIERICSYLGKSREEMLRGFESSFMISADLTHGVHPNKQAESDPTNRPVFGGGTAIKMHAGKAYATDSYSASVYMGICESIGAEYQHFANRSDKRSGSTIGSIMASHLPIHIVDVGIPVLAMHSTRELANVEDYMSYYKSFYQFYRLGGC